MAHSELAGTEIKKVDGVEVYKREIKTMIPDSEFVPKEMPLT